MKVGTHGWATKSEIEAIVDKLFIPKGVMVRLHGRLVRKIEIQSNFHSEVSIYTNSDWFLMVEADGRTWLWYGMLDP